MGRVTVQAEPFDPAAEIAAVGHADPSVGAVASFVGLVRERNDGAPVSEMLLEHYPGMTEQALEGIVAEAEARWRLREVRVVHRVGSLRPTDPIVLVAVASGHRGDAFAACEFIMDYLKTRAPFWKKEATPGGGRWVEARESDEQARQRWEEPGASSDSD
jgi:molybdopterin synthase catalytic subunit